jgi:hypothetical protein
MITEVLQGVKTIEEGVGLPCHQICERLGIPYPSYRRWELRKQAGVPLLLLPGPKKVVPFDPDFLEAEIQTLVHRRKLSYGTGELSRRWSGLISRRDFQELVKKARTEANREDRLELCRISWAFPNLVWGMDDLQIEFRDEEGGKLYGNRMQDLASRYKFPPLTGDFPCGAEVAGYLDARFTQFGAPLFLKRDNRKNLNHPEVNGLLSEYLVIPLNSPPYYAQYNGGIERSQGEFQKVLREELSPETFCPQNHFQAYAENAEHDLNHRPRPSLGGKTSCQIYFEGKDKRKFSKRERREIYDWIFSLASDILKANGDYDEVSWATAWRIAAETWLLKRGYITRTKPRKVSPYFSEKSAH